MRESYKETFSKSEIINAFQQIPIKRVRMERKLFTMFPAEICRKKNKKIKPENILSFERYFHINL